MFRVEKVVSCVKFMSCLFSIVDIIMLSLVRLVEFIYPHMPTGMAGYIVYSLFVCLFLCLSSNWQFVVELFYVAFNLVPACAPSHVSIALNVYCHLGSWGLNPLPLINSAILNSN